MSTGWQGKGAPYSTAQITHVRFWVVPPKMIWPVETGVIFFFLIFEFFPQVYLITLVPVYKPVMQKKFILDVWYGTLHHPTQALLGVLGKWERALSWRDLTTLEGWRGDHGYINKIITHKKFINRVKLSAVCQIDRREYIEKQDPSQTNVLPSEYRTMCYSCEGFSKVACNTPWGKKKAFRTQTRTAKSN